MFLEQRVHFELNLIDRRTRVCFLDLHSCFILHRPQLSIDASQGLWAEFLRQILLKVERGCFTILGVNQVGGTVHGQFAELGHFGLAVLECLNPVFEKLIARFVTLLARATIKVAIGRAAQTPVF